MGPPYSRAVEPESRWDMVQSREKKLSNKKEFCFLLFVLPLINHCGSVLQSTFESLFKNHYFKKTDLLVFFVFFSQSL